MPDARILVVDDDPDSLEIVRTYLESRGYQVTTAPDGRAALAMLEDARPDLVSLDVMTPGSDGWEVARTITDHPEASATRAARRTPRRACTHTPRGTRA